MSKGQVVDLRVNQEIMQRLNMLTSELERVSVSSQTMIFQMAQDIGRLGLFVNFLIKKLKDSSPDTQKVLAEFEEFKKVYSAEQAKMAEEMVKQQETDKEEKPLVTLTGE